MDARQVLIVGAGAAGIMAALRAAELGAQTTILEKTKRLGTKILISGGGKCNITHDGPLEEVLRAFVPEEARFIRPACYRYPPQRIVELLTGRGLEVYTRPDGRIFPVGQTAKDVVRILGEVLGEAGVEILFQEPVLGITKLKEGFRVLSQTREWRVVSLVVCTGGKSYPNSGTTGDGWAWLKELGHTIVPTRAALAPIELTEPLRDLSGLALRSVTLKARAAGKELARWTADLLLTHLGISGPTALGISRKVAVAMESGLVSLEVDVAPDLSYEELRDKLIREANAAPRLKVSTLLTDWVPERLAREMAEALSLPGEGKMKDLDKKSRNRLIETLKAWKLGDVSHVPLDLGEVTAGGVSLDEVDPMTMESRIVPGLFLCGEILDVAGPVGGYNLQAAWATGYVAGESAAKRAFP